FQAEDGIRDRNVTGVQTCALPISAEQSEEIKHITSRNYGHLLPAFVDYLFKVGEHTINEIYEAQISNLLDEMPESNTKIRIAGKLAVILTTVELVNQSQLLHVDLKGIMDILIQYEINHLEERDLGATALDKLMQYLIVNKRALTPYGHNTIG